MTPIGFLGWKEFRFSNEETWRDLFVSPSTLSHLDFPLRISIMFNYSFSVRVTSPDLTQGIFIYKFRITGSRLLVLD